MGDCRQLYDSDPPHHVATDKEIKQCNVRHFCKVVKHGCKIVVVKKDGKDVNVGTLRLLFLVAFHTLPLSILQHMPGDLFGDGR